MRYCLTVLLLVLAHGRAWPAPGAELDQLLARLDRIRAAHEVAATGFALVSRERTLYAGVLGIAERASGRAADSATRFRIGSITKAFTGLVLAEAEARGQLALEAPFVDIAGPGLLDNPWAACAPVTIAQLLEHTAGLTDLTHEEMYHSDPAPLALAAAVRRYAANRVVRWRPGRYYSYSNAGPGLAAYALERVSGIVFERHLTAVLLQPLGMTETSMRLDDATAAALAAGYDHDGHSTIPYWHMLMRPFGAINATPRDMARFLHLLLNEGTAGGQAVISPTAYQRALRPTTSLAARRGLEAGYGLGLYAWEAGGLRFYGHGGDGDGYLAHLGFSPAAGLGYFVVINAFNHEPLARMRRVIEAYVASRAAPTTQSPPLPELPPGAESAAGAYLPATFRFGERPPAPAPAFELAVDGTSLLRQAATGTPRRLLPVDGKLWRYADERLPTVLITRDGGEQLFLAARGAYRRDADRPALEHLPCR